MRQRAQQIGEEPRTSRRWKGTPNQVATLARNRVPYPLQRHCSVAGCRKVALRGKPVCLVHAGRRPVRDGAFGRAESRYLAQLERRGLLPLDLLALPVWRRLTNFPTKQRAPMRLELLRAWDKRAREPMLWARTQKQALGLVAEPTSNGRTRHTAFWAENL